MHCVWPGPLTSHLNECYKIATCCCIGPMWSCTAAQTIFMVFWFKYTEFLFSLYKFSFFFPATAFATLYETEGGGGGSIRKSEGIKMRPRYVLCKEMVPQTDWLTENGKCYAVVLILMNLVDARTSSTSTSVRVWIKKIFMPISMVIKIPRVITLNQRRRHTSRHINHAQVIRYRLLVHRNDEWTQITNK